MAVKAAYEVTITDETDVLALVTWYALTSSATAPTKPSTTTTSATVPSPWTTSEPSFNPANGTRYLYTCIQTRWKDGTCTWDNNVQLSSSYEQAKQAWNKANAAQTSVDNLEIGGRNLLLKSPRSYVSGNYDAYTLAFIDPLEIGQKYTIQLWDVDVSHTGKTAEQLGIFVYIGGGNANTGANWQGTSYFTDGHADHLTRTFTYTQSLHDASGGTNKWLVLYNSVPSANGTKTMSVGKWKLEKGDKATDWTPAPEDSSSFPIVSKTYTGVNITANNDPTGWLYFGSIKPTSYYTPWRVKYVLRARITTLNDSNQYSVVTIDGAKNAYYAYQTYNMVANTSYRPIYSHLLYTLKEAGVNAGYGHLLGIRFQSAYWGSTFSATAWPREVTVEVLEAENCSVELANSMFLYANAPGTGATNYQTRTAFDGTTQGFTESGDRNETNHLLNNFSGRTGPKGIRQYSLFMQDGDGNYQGICTHTDGNINNSITVTSTKKANTNGFRVGSKLYYPTFGTVAANTNFYVSPYASYGLFDTRYSLGTTLTAGSLTTYKPVYLVGTIHGDGLFYLDETWWTQTATDVDKVYVHVGYCYDSNTSNCRMNLVEPNLWCVYDGTKLVEMNFDRITTAEDNISKTEESISETNKSVSSLDDYVRGHVYVLTTDTTAKEGVAYFSKSVVDDYVPARVNVGDSVSGLYIYTNNTWTAASGTAQAGVDYFQKVQVDEYTQSDVAVGASVSGLYVMDDSNSLSGAISAIGGDVTTLQGDVGGIQQNVGVLQGSVGTIQTNVETIQTNVGTLQADQAALKDAHDAIAAEWRKAVKIDNENGKVTVGYKDNDGNFVGGRAETNETGFDVIMDFPDPQNQNQTISKVVAHYGESAQIGALDGTHIIASGDQLLFLPAGAEPNIANAVAYIDIDPQTQESVFYMTRSVVVKDMFLGEGKWKFFKRENNNLSLKWMGEM